MLRKLRIAVAALFFVGLTLLLAGVAGEWFSWMAKLQFLPSCLALNGVVIACTLLFCIIFGRLYCSVICPLGVLQDGVIWLRKMLGKVTKRKLTKRFTYTKERKWLRGFFLGLLLASLFAGLQPVVAFIAPYSAYGRMVRSIVAPSWPVWVVAAASFVGIVLCSWFWGRAWCSNICPVGTFLGFFSRHALVRPQIDTTKCTNCGRCSRGCKTSCIDFKNHTIDLSRCVDCFDCIYRCKEKAITFSLRKPAPAVDTQPDAGRRSALKSIALTGGALALGGIDLKAAESEPQRAPQTPPGSESAKHFYSRCTACQLCVTACPNDVLRASDNISRLMQPEMHFDKGWCRPECNTCSTVCPTGAILPLKPFEKSNIQTGLAVIDHEACLSWSGSDHCESCTVHCPYGAIRFPEGADGPFVIETVCTGCGACEHLCPAKAIKVEALAQHIVR